MIDFDKPIKNSSKFQGPARHFQAHGVYCFAPVGTTEYDEYWDREQQRCIYGYTAPDGDWISGYNYFYLNYSPILRLVQKEVTDRHGRVKIKRERTREFADFYDTDYYYFLAVDEAEEEGKHVSVLKARGKGYEQPYSELVATPDGFRQMGDLKEGEFVMNPDGRPTKVIQIHEHGYKDVYEMVFDDGRVVRCGEEHLWQLTDVNSSGNKSVVKRTRDLFHEPLYKTYDGYNHYRYYIEPISEVEYSEKEYNIHPYILGALLGDGDMTNGNVKISSTDDELINRMASILGDDYSLNRDYTTFNYNISVSKSRRFDNEKNKSFENYKYGVNPLRRYIDSMSLNVGCADKFIPTEYKYGSIEQRYELVRGLMDTDGYCSKDGSIEFTNTSKELTEDLAEVLRSLGIRCEIGTDKRTDKFAYRLHIRTNKPIFSLSRKLERLNRSKKINSKVALIDIRRLDYQEKSRCITVAHENHLYLTRGYVPTHNSFKGASMLVRNFYHIPESKSYAIASENAYLVGDGLLTKAWDLMDFIDEHTAWSKKRQAVNTKMHRRASILTTDEMGNKIEVGYKSEIIGISLKNDPNKARGKRGKLILWEESGCHIKGTKVMLSDGRLANVEDVMVGDELMGPDGTPRKVLERHTGIDNMYRVTPKNGHEQIVNSNHIIYGHKQDYYGSEPVEFEMTPIQYMEEMKKNPKRKYHYSLIRPDFIDFKKKEVLIDPYVMGLWLGDGDSRQTAFSSNDKEVIDFIDSYGSTHGLYPKHYEIKGTNCITIHLSSGKRRAKNWMLDELRRLNVLNNKHIHDDYVYTDRESRLKLLAGLIDTDGSYSEKKRSIEITQHESRKQIIDKAAFIARSLGMRVSVSSRISKDRHLNGKLVRGGEVQWRLVILNGHEAIPTLIKRKQSKNRSGVLKNENSTRFDVSYYGVDEYYGFTVDKDNLFLIDDFTIVHNSFKDILQAWQIARPSVEEDGVAFGLMIAFGTGGDDSSKFDGLKELFYNPSGYNIKSFDNIWDEGASGSTCGFFVPVYANMSVTDENGNRLFIDSDGNTLKDKALSYVMNERKKVVEGATDSRAVDRYVAENPITPQEACLELTGNIFPKKELQTQLSLIRTNRKLQNHKQVGDLIWVNGELVWQQKKSGDIIKYPLGKDDKTDGSIVIWEHPMKDAPIGLYIGGNDPYDFDKADNSTSLGSTIIYKRFQGFEEYYDIIVAEYTGRPNTADEYYENVMKLLLYYNARLLYENEKKGLFTYFSNKHRDYLLADQPDIINDIIGKSTVNRRKGIHMTKEIIAYSEILIKDWLNEEYAPGHKNISRILSEPLLEELIQYNDKGNFDRVRALQCLMIYRQQLYNTTVKKKEREERNTRLFDKPLFSKEWFETSSGNSNQIINI